jgi:hypothetical protein
MKWMFPHYVEKKGIKITHLANDCAEELNLSPQVLRIKLSEWKNMTEVPKQENFIQRLIVIARKMDVPIWMMLDLDVDEDKASEMLMAYQLGLDREEVLALDEKF